MRQRLQSEPVKLKEVELTCKTDEVVNWLAARSYDDRLELKRCSGLAVAYKTTRTTRYST